MTFAPATVLLACALALPHASRAAEEREGSRPRDAAEAVQEGSVSNWLKYYQREREQRGAPGPPPAQPTPAPVTSPPSPPVERR
jgi:hypothetical protein